MPGVQAWYNQFLTVDPADPEHVYAGLEEVYETKDAGATWSTAGPYWNFTFPCWRIDPAEQTGDCSPTTHSDQHGVAIGRYHGRSYVYVGNDGGAYRRPVDGSQDSSGHATDWTSLNDGTIDTLQYYSVGIGRDLEHHGVSVTGGLQDNGQSILRGDDRVMGSNFGGDGGDTLTDPADGCNMAEEYVYLSVQVTQNCAVNDGSWVTDPGSDLVQRRAGRQRHRRGPVHRTPRGRHEEQLHLGRGRPARLGADPWLRHPQRLRVEERVRPRRRPHRDRRRGLRRQGVRGLVRPLQREGVRPRHLRGQRGRHRLARHRPARRRYRAQPLPQRLRRRPAERRPRLPRGQRLLPALDRGPGAGTGHVFESTDGGTTWKDVSADLPDVPPTPPWSRRTAVSSSPPTSASSTGRRAAPSGSASAPCRPSPYSS